MIGIVALLLFLLAVFMLAQSLSKAAKAIRNQYGVLKGRITYSDLGRQAEPLFSSRFGLVGKPDYIVEVKGKSIPVEIKSGVLMPHFEIISFNSEPTAF